MFYVVGDVHIQMKKKPGLALNLRVGADLAVAAKARKDLTKKGMVGSIIPRNTMNLPFVSHVTLDISKL